jgi:hypothetical protein
MVDKGKIFLIGRDTNELIAMDETPFEKEDLLQVLLEEHPDLLPGDQIDPENPVRWLLVKREMGVPGTEQGGGIWSLDHLFLDHEGIPTFVECKRASDTRARREVVAQMLDYAANGIKYWSMDRLRQDAAETARRNNRAVDEEIRHLIRSDDEGDVEEYWGKVEENLSEGRVRLIFVTDETPRDLRRLVEFLNDKMRDVEVLAVEVRQYLGKNGQKVLVPRVIGLTEAAREVKGTSRVAKPFTNRDEFLAKCDPLSKEFFDWALSLASAENKVIYWGTLGFSIRTPWSGREGLYTFAYGWPHGQFDFFFGLPLSEEEASGFRAELMSFGVFSEAGKKTLKVRVAPETLDPLREVVSFIFKRVNEFSSAGAGAVNK